ncbi:aminoglycoside phosphotransferase (APT) family kinase protein [Bradyrhizobium sp. USDA 4524]|uniref:phosphotransferase family protein n=1 Tax=Bradyrhizobium TaxID=374 RepID=UPI00209D6C68|nr:MULTISPECIES: phosphotransferase [Bradyrhizobium]MCP1838038.1 aminoglycoside phosphotransferase (APT) family kinase protein [Bradyrhizobium sp. USDA 4538]MCP1898603.1 aminoglycoside phosphotransferase (APT) family kinase protein [Bradyrhizobium sp. USDA 4537]MCP1987287.1 aminoglycoside phosphotransferase (APT) family kinase protein [Bradyrhizobium sp. USDA 4539]MCP3416341.1 phosphotransferase family protein [Bradyrhizobium brasilense]
MARLYEVGQLMQEAAKRSDDAPAAPEPVRPVAVDDDTVRAALAQHLSRISGIRTEITRFGRKSSGFSWITYAFVARSAAEDDRKLILRVGPPNGLFAPYSVLPQVYALRSLAGSGVPVPALVSFEQDGAEIGFPFFICEHIEGDVPAPWAASELDPDHKRAVARQFVEILASLHRVDADATPFASRHHSGERAEVRAIAGWRASLARPTARYYPLLDWGGRWLQNNCPRPPRRTIVHGDYRIGNFIEHNGRITAILDWELTHLGDPHEDLAWAMMPTFNARSRKLYGVLERAEVIDLYQRASGIPVSDKSLAFYEAYALYQAAAIQMCAVRAFEVDRFNDMRLAVMASQMPSIVRAFERALEAAA